MARPFIMVKMINNTEYAYLYKDVKNEQDGRHKAVMVRYLGRLDNLIKAVDKVLRKRGYKIVTIE